MSTLIPEFTLPKDFCADAREAYTIPARFYTHQAAFEHEKEQVFATSWICVAHRSELAQPNDYITREIIGENILVVRGRDNVLRAFYNVCPHRGHQLLAGDGRAKNVITCPYHAWAFKLDGELAHARNCENVQNFDKENSHLMPVRVEEYAGFIYVNLDSQAGTVEDQLPGLGAKVREACPQVDDLKLAARFVTRTPANWKNIVDNYLECYHCGQHTPASPTRCRSTATGTPCTATGRCSSATPALPSSRSSLKRVKKPASTASGCGRAPCSTCRRWKA